MALSAPRRLRSLTLLSSGFASRTDADRGERGRRFFEVLQQSAPIGAQGQIRRQMDQWRMLCGRAFRFDEEVWERRTRSWVERGQNPSCPHVRLGPEVFGVDRSERYRELVIPAHVFHGDDDPMFPLAHGQAIAASIPCATLSVFRGRGHELFLDADIAASIASDLASRV